MSRPIRVHVFVAVISGLAALAPAAELLLPQGRTAFQTNEWIDISVVRSSDQPLAAGDLKLTLSDQDGSRLAFSFPVIGGGNRKTEHLHVNGWLLRPGKYTVEVAVDGQTATGEIEVYSHIRQSSFRLINWGRANTREQQLVQGEDSLGFNLFYGHYGGDNEAHLIRAGVDYMANCVMSGGHQMDLRSECDWSDPYVTRGGTRRVVRRAMIDRMRPNVPGVHFYDEPGLTWSKDPVTGQFGPHRVPSQLRSYASAFDREPPPFHQLDPNNPEHVARWRHWALWKLSFMDAAWKEAQFGVSAVRPDFLSVTQSQYGWSAFTDGYYFNVARCLPVTSGHGGYHDYGLGTFNPSYFLEMARARDRGKPCWYLPTWYGNTTADQFRLEQYLSFQTGIQGMISPPDCEPATNPVPRQGIVESNQLMKKLGTIFTTMPPTKPPVALLYSMSQCIHAQTLDRSANYAHGNPHGQKLALGYFAAKLIQHPFFTVLDEDVLDGTLAADHKAVVLTGLDYLDPQVIAALEAFASGGGLVLLTGDCTVQIKGAKKLAVVPRLPDQEKVDELSKAGRWGELGPYTTVSKYVEGVLPLARAIRAELDQAGIRPVFECDTPTIAATRQAAGDVEYLFAVNFTPDGTAKNDQGQPINNLLKPTAATITLPDDGRPVYDAVRGGLAREFKPEGGKLIGRFRFGPGQMHVFAQTAQPLGEYKRLGKFTAEEAAKWQLNGSVRMATPIVSCDLVQETSPITLHIATAVVDAFGVILSGSVPIHVRVVDSLGLTRYELYQATKQGQFSTSLPLAVNDPAGSWKVVIRELLNNTESEAGFTYTPPPRARSLTGATRRAIVAANDDDNVFRFARLHQEVTIVKGANDFNNAAADRLIRVLEPWGVRCKVMPLAEAAKSRWLREDEAATWCGLVYAGRGQIKPGDGNPPSLAGFAVQGPVILLGNPDDNAIVKFLLQEQFLPYRPDQEKFPGVGRGMLAWQRDGMGPGQESITLIAYDEAGMQEAVGTFYEAVAGIEPLTRWSWPSLDGIVPATTAAPVPTGHVEEIARLPDRVLGLKLEGGQLTALSHDGTQLVGPPAASFYVEGKISVVEGGYAELARQLATPANPADVAAAPKQSDPTRLVKFVVPHGEQTAVAYWGGTLDLRDKDGKTTSRTRLAQDITALASDGKSLFAGLADGRIVLMSYSPNL